MEVASEGHERGFPRPTAIEWFALVASLALTLQYSWLLDDAFVYFRYVDNLVHLERGLVFNAGEYVEGYSSPLWCLLLIPLRWIGLDWWMVVRLLGLVCATGSWALLVVLARRLAPRGAAIINVPLVYLAFNYAVQTYNTSGVEAPLVQLTAVAFALYVVAPRSVVAQVLLGLAPMVRHELALPFAIALAWTWWSTKRIAWSPILVCAASLGPWLVFRAVYYADFLPNTFYLKDEVNWGRGLRYLHDTFVVYGTYVLVPSFGLIVWLLRSKPDVHIGARTTMVIAALAVCAYVAKIGGDPRHYRYLAFPFCLLACAMAGLLEHTASTWPGERRKWLSTAAALGIAAVSFCFFPRQLHGHPFDRAVAHSQVDDINDAQFHRLKPDLTYSPWTVAPDIERLGDEELDLIYGDSPLLPPAGADIRDEYARWLASGETSADYPISTQGWCATAWRMFTHTLVHKDGLTDAILARTSAASWRAAHKQELFPLAADLARLRNQFGSDPGAFRRALEAGAAPPWIERNLASIELIAHKAFNHHEWGPNFALALRRIPRIQPGENPTSTTIPGRAPK